MKLVRRRRFALTFSRFPNNGKQARTRQKSVVRLAQTAADNEPVHSFILHPAKPHLDWLVVLRGENQLLFDKFRNALFLFVGQAIPAVNDAFKFDVNGCQIEPPIS